MAFVEVVVGVHNAKVRGEGDGGGGEEEGEAIEEGEEIEDKVYKKMRNSF